MLIVFASGKPCRFCLGTGRNFVMQKLTPTYATQHPVQAHVIQMVACVICSGRGVVLL